MFSLSLYINTIFKKMQWVDCTAMCLVWGNYKFALSALYIEKQTCD